MSGVCSECGLEVEWRDLLHPERTMPRWLVENRLIRRSRLVWSMLSTTWRCLLALRFWRAVRMVHPVSVPRLVGLVAAWAVLLYSVVWITVFVRGSYAMNWFTGTGSFNFSPDYVLPSVIHAVIWPRIIIRHPKIMFLLLFLVLTPAVFVVLPDSMRTGRVRWVHIVRAAAYEMGWLMIWTLVIVCLDMGLWVLWLLDGTVPNFFDAPRTIELNMWLAGCLAWSVYWWSVVTWRYLKLHMWWAVTLSIVSVAALAAFVVPYYRVVYG